MMRGIFLGFFPIMSSKTRAGLILDRPLSTASSRIATGEHFPDVVCFSHLRWDFVFQRPQHLMTRCARDRRVFFVEEPRPTDGAPRLHLQQTASGVWVATPEISPAAGREMMAQATRGLLRDLLDVMGSREHVAWYLTPMAAAITQDLDALVVVYDCMDELSAFACAPPELREAEAMLLARADLVFTGGWSLYEAKRTRHARVSLFPSSVDVPHFARARAPLPEPDDQRGIPGPRLGYVGVIDERMDLALLAGLADARPDWHLVMVGPVVKIDPAILPRRPNLHYLGQRPYEALPAYLAGWDVALMPFARNEATRYISPTKTPEYLAAGRPVVSTSVRDVVTPYGELGLVEIADDVDAFVAAIERVRQTALAERLAKVDAYLAGRSWDRTWAAMRHLIDDMVQTRRRQRARPTAVIA
jgi:UDP-galactopyranose mutase